MLQNNQRESHIVRPYASVDPQCTSGAELLRALIKSGGAMKSALDKKYREEALDQAMAESADIGRLIREFSEDADRLEAMGFSATEIETCLKQKADRYLECSQAKKRLALQ